MGVSITRIVKFIRKGERGNSVINAVTSIRRFPLATWQRIGAANYAFTWANISNYADMKIGDMMVIQGVVTDKDDISVTYYGTVTTINTTSVRTIATALIMSGTNGSSFAAQYSVDGSTNWHATFTNGDIYMRTSADGGKTWSAAIKIVGEKGGETNYQFAWSSHKTLDDSEYPLSDVVDWYDYPPAQTDANKPYLWTMITTPDNKVSYARLTGEKGDKGDNGKDAVTIYVDPNTILHKKAASNSTYAVTVKLKEGEKYIDYGTNYGQFVATTPNYSALSTGLACITVISSDSIRYDFTIKANAEVNLEAKIKIRYKGIDYWRSIPIKTVANGDKGDKGDKGDQGNPGEPGSPGSKGDRGPALRGPQMWNDCGVGYVFQSGADGEEYKDIVLYNNNYYSCTKTHAKTASNAPLSTISNSSGLWKLADKLEIIATKILLAQYALVKNLGVEAIDMKDSAGNIIFQAKDGNVICNSGTFKNGTFTNVKVIGSLRNPFSLANDSFDVNYSDNVAMLSSGGGWIEDYSMPWDVSQNGRKISIVNYRWGSSYAQGQAAISAPSGKYFFEDGIQKSELKVSREIIELIGYGTNSEFYGWIVVNRIDLMTSQKYGHCLKALAYGTVTGTNKTASISYKAFDGSNMGVSRLNTGVYKVTFPTTWFSYANNCRVILTGRGYAYNETSPCKASLASVGSGSITVDTSDDSSRNDGSFDFIIYNGSDFDIL